jgi:hypothetical protein
MVAFAPTCEAVWSRISSTPRRPIAAIDDAPAARAIWIMRSENGPGPTTTTTSPGRTATSSMAFAATASGSSSAPSSQPIVSGSGTSRSAGSAIRSANAPPSSEAPTWNQFGSRFSWPASVSREYGRAQITWRLTRVPFLRSPTPPSTTVPAAEHARDGDRLSSRMRPIANGDIRAADTCTLDSDDGVASASLGLRPIDPREPSGTRVLLHDRLHSLRTSAVSVVQLTTTGSPTSSTPWTLGTLLTSSVQSGPATR